MLRLVLSILGYIGVLYIGASTLYISFKIVEAISNKSIKSSSRFLHFVSLHEYGFRMLLWFFLMLISVCAIFYLNTDRRSESERKEEYQAAYEDGFRDGRDEGYSSGRSEGFDEFYDSRYDSGYEAAEYDHRNDYDNGYDRGYEDGRHDFYPEAYEEGYRDGYSNGFDEGSDVGYATALEDAGIEP